MQVVAHIGVVGDGVGAGLVFVEAPRGLAKLLRASETAVAGFFSTAVAEVVAAPLVFRVPSVRAAKRHRLARCSAAGRAGGFCGLAKIPTARA